MINLSNVIFFCYSVLFFGYGLILLYAGFQGAFYHFGFGLLIWFSLCVLLFARQYWVLIILAFFCATDVWGWEWYWAALFVAPGLTFHIPVLLLAMIGFVMALLQKKD